MNCHDYLNGLRAYMEGGHDADVRTLMERHLGSCRSCSDFMVLAREISCREVAEFLDDYVEGRLATERRAVFDRHLGICLECVAYLQSYRATMEASRTAFAASLEPAPGRVPPELVAAILAARGQGPGAPAAEGG